MEYANILNVAGRHDFRRWLETHYDTESECWVKVKRGKPDNDIDLWYLNAVEEALCFGWIDSTAKSADGMRLQRFTPRAKNSPWTELNKERVRRLEKLGLMTDAGRRALPAMGPRSFKIDSELEQELKSARVWSSFKKLHPLYQRVRAYNLMFYRARYPEAYHRMLAHTIETAKKGKTFGDWNDYGRLLNY